jgi:hypothetical protein
VKLKKKIRKRLAKPLRKLVKDYGPLIAAEMVTALIAAAVARKSAGGKKKHAKRRAIEAAE